MASKQFNLKKILEANKKVRADQLEKNLEAIQDVKRAGIPVGPNYRLGSPFSRRRAARRDTPKVDPPTRLRISR
jgi:hypothetical protein